MYRRGRLASQPVRLVPVRGGPRGWRADVDLLLRVSLKTGEECGRLSRTQREWWRATSK
jgi:hypothetical protein